MLALSKKNRKPGENIDKNNVSRFYFMTWESGLNCGWERANISNF